VIVRPLVCVDDQSAVQFNDVRVIVCDELISGPVAANYYVLSHGYLLGGNTDTGIFPREQGDHLYPIYPKRVIASGPMDYKPAAMA
jgi:hypothetical protein